MEGKKKKMKNVDENLIADRRIILIIYAHARAGFSHTYGYGF